MALSALLHVEARKIQCHLNNQPSYNHRHGQLNDSDTVAGKTLPSCCARQGRVTALHNAMEQYMVP